MSVTRLEPPIEVDTPRGRAFAFFLIDYVMNAHVVWGCVQRDSGQWWWFQNPEVRHAPCETFGIRLDEIRSRYPSLIPDDLSKPVNHG